MILLVTNKYDATADRVVDALDRRGAPFVRLNTEDLPAAVRCRYRFGPDGDSVRLDLGHGRILTPEEVRAVWYRRPEPAEIDAQVTDPVARRFARRESEAAWRAFLVLAAGARWVNHPDADRAAEHKPAQLRAALAEGFRIPETLVTNDPREAAGFLDGRPGGVVAKSLGPAFIDPRTRAQVFTTRIGPEHAAYLGDLRHGPVILQERIDKALELRVTVVGDQVFAAAIDSQASVTTRDDWRRDVFRAPHEAYALRTDVADRCRRLVRRFGLVFGTLDLIVTPGGEHVFLEVNPNGEWDWIEALTGLPIADAVAGVLAGDGGRG